METQIIYSGGDVVLCNGTGGSAERFLVSTIFLKNASKVFTAMFSDRFAEGQQLSSANPPDVTLEQDNMLGVLLRMLHLRYKAVPHKLSREELQALAALADKYGCAHAVVPACSAWFAHFRSLPTQDNDHIFLTEAAFLLKYDVEFAFWTKQAILNMSEHFQARPESKLPIEVLLTLEQQRSSVRQALSRGVEKMQIYRTCNGCEQVFASFLPRKNAIQYALNTESISTVCVALHEARQKLPDVGHEYNCYVIMRPLSEKTFQFLIDTAKDACKGVCLACFHGHGCEQHDLTN